MRNRGFSLVELLVAVAIFSLLVGASTGFFISAVRGQRKALTFQELSSQTSYLMEYMSRALRMAKKDTLGVCIPAKLNYQKTYAGQGIRFQNYKDECQEFYLEAGQIKENKDGAVLDLTSIGFVVVSFSLGPDSSWDQLDDEQPRVTFSLNIRSVSPKPELQAETKIQTTISQRNLDIQY